MEKNSEKEKNIKIEFYMFKTKSRRLCKKSFLNKSFTWKVQKLKMVLFLYGMEMEIITSQHMTKFFDRKSINQICRTILTNNGKKLNAEGRKKLEGTDYNIVNGDIPYFNYAIIGTHRLAQNVIENSDGNEEEMKENLHQIMNKIWGKDDE